MKKEVQRDIKEVRISIQEELRLALLKAIKNHISPIKFAKSNHISKQKLSYHLRVLREKEKIKKVGYGTWELTKRSPKLSKDYPEVRGHAFIWKVKIPRNVVTNWRTRCIKFMIPFKSVGILKTPRIIVDARKVWLGKKHIIIYENTSFMGKDAIQSRKYAIYELLEMVKKIEDALCINLRRPIIFSAGREHYALIKNLLAIQCNKKKEPIKIRDLDGYWLSTDNSLNQDELENDGKKAFETNIPMQKWWNDHKQNGFKVTPSFTLEAINKVTQNQVMFAENIDKHMQVLKDISKEVKNLGKAVRGLKK